MLALYIFLMVTKSFKFDPLVYLMVYAYTRSRCGILFDQKTIHQLPYTGFNLSIPSKTTDRVISIDN